jgi:bacteriorhodopsin
MSAYNYAATTTSKDANSPISNGTMIPVTNTINASVPLIPGPPPSAPTSTLGENATHPTIDQKINPTKYYVKYSFMITYILLLTTATLTFIEAIRTNIPSVRHVLNFETCISLVAGYFYSVFLGQIDGYEKEGKEIIWADITKTRYVDWSITTPMMLLAISIALCQQSGEKIHLWLIVLIILLNYAMLLTGCLGEFNFIEKELACFLGFIPFIAMFWLIYSYFVKPKPSVTGNFLFGVYVLVWSLYGIFYLLEENIKNIGMNILDCIAKCLIGNFLFVYYSKMIVV